MWTENTEMYDIYVGYVMDDGWVGGYFFITLVADLLLIILTMRLGETPSPPSERI